MHEFKFFPLDIQNIKKYINLCFQTEKCVPWLMFKLKKKTFGVGICN